MSDKDSSNSSGSFPKYLEHLSGDGKAIGVLTSGGDAQGARLPALSPVSGAEREAREGGWPERVAEEVDLGGNRGRAEEERWVTWIWEKG